MLAKDIKIKTLKKQREFIKEQLSHVDFQKDGNPAYCYIGYIYPEVINYFEEEEGLLVSQVHSDLLSVLTKGMPVYRFIPNIKLSDEEMKQAEAYNPEEPKDDSAEDLPDFLKFLLDGGRF